ncbi:hypothetical protein V9T40_005855 [Parthenolecanium corni]|uniref:Uncharacterized protein n=1 Tax=Parthenolecanium corni TaxID=536013 RepID=A0AAN9YAV2_9HEMI
MLHTASNQWHLLDWEYLSSPEKSQPSTEPLTLSTLYIYRTCPSTLKSKWQTSSSTKEDACACYPMRGIGLQVVNIQIVHCGSQFTNTTSQAGLVCACEGVRPSVIHFVGINSLIQRLSPLGFTLIPSPHKPPHSVPSAATRQSPNPRRPKKTTMTLQELAATFDGMHHFPSRPFSSLGLVFFTARNSNSLKIVQLAPKNLSNEAPSDVHQQQQDRSPND